MELHVEEYGTGKPALVLMHGFGGSARNLRPQARFFQSEHRVVLFDLRGHARSGAPDDPAEYSLEKLIGDVQQVIEKSGELRVVLGGVSMGAAIALAYAFDHPERVLALVLASYPGSTSSSWALDLATAIETRGLESAGEEFVWGGSRFDPEARRFIRQGFLEHRAHGLSHSLRGVLSALPTLAAMEKSLAELRVPVLLIAGAEDAPSVSASQELARRLRHAKLEIIAAAGHVVNLQNPQAFNVATRGFLREVET